MSETQSGLAKLREPFPPHQISKLPKPTVKRDEWDKLPKGRCAECGGWHPKDKTIHLDYVGHAALTDRLLDADPNWAWEPLAIENGLPKFDDTGGLWIKLTVCGHTRLGYGNARNNPYAEVGSREKEVIGDALRNAAMRFGAALELWHKGELHVEDEKADEPEQKTEPTITDSQVADLAALAQEVGADLEGFRKYLKVDKLENLPASKYSRAVQALESKRIKPEATDAT